MNSDEKGCNENSHCIIGSKKDIGVDIDVKPIISCRPKEKKICDIDIDVKFNVKPCNVTLYKVGEKSAGNCSKICCYRASIELRIEPELKHTKPPLARCEAEFDVQFDAQIKCAEQKEHCDAGSYQTVAYDDDLCNCDKCSRFNNY